MNKLLIVCGPTASGKTALGVKLAHKFDGEIVSADSRQVYKGFDVLTGKDLPLGAIPITKNTVKVGRVTYSLVMYKIDNIPVWLYDAADFLQPISIAIYEQLANEAITDITNRGKLPILLGGSGLYINAVTKKIETISVPPNKALRAYWDGRSIELLQAKVKDVAVARWEKMNRSDRHNPRRLIRVLEVAQSEHGNLSPKRPDYDCCWVGIALGDGDLKLKIRQRVSARWDGAVREVRVAKAQLSQNKQIASALGMEPIVKFLDGELSVLDAQESWAIDDAKYAKRQMVWFRKQPHIKWFGSQARYTDIEKHVSSWYTA